MSEPPKIVVTPPGPQSRAYAARLAKAECPAFDARRDAREETSGVEQAPVVYARGAGANVFDVDGNRYVDLVAGFGALIFGHSPSAVKKAVSAQEEKLSLALGDVYASDVKVELCERLAAIFPEPGARVMLGLSGA
ncbi:MAG: aminotransferase class III-fold pyridoxal phosphate-dependent enzyme, partial [Polyangiaceae bacterium]